MTLFSGGLGTQSQIWSLAAFAAGSALLGGSALAGSALPIFGSGQPARAHEPPAPSCAAGKPPCRSPGLSGSPRSRHRPVWPALARILGRIRLGRLDSKAVGHARLGRRFLHHRPLGGFLGRNRALRRLGVDRRAHRLGGRALARFQLGLLGGFLDAALAGKLPQLLLRLAPLLERILSGSLGRFLGRLLGIALGCLLTAAWFAAGSGAGSLISRGARAVAGFSSSAARCWTGVPNNSGLGLAFSPEPAFSRWTSVGSGAGLSIDFACDRRRPDGSPASSSRFLCRGHLPPAAAGPPGASRWWRPSTTTVASAVVTLASVSLGRRAHGARVRLRLGDTQRVTGVGRIALPPMGSCLVPLPGLGCRRCLGL